MAEELREEKARAEHRPAPRRDFRAEQAAESKAAESARLQILEAFEKLGEAVLWRWIAGTLARADADGLGERIAKAAERRALKMSEAHQEPGNGWEPLPALLAWIDDAKGGGPKRLALELLITSFGVSGELDQGHLFASAAALAGLDFAGMRRATFAEAGLDAGTDDARR